MEAKTSPPQSILKSRSVQSAAAITSGKRRTLGSPETPVDSHAGAQDRPHASSQGSWFEALEILAQDGDRFQVSWAGIDPSTGKEWKPTWVCLSAYETHSRYRGRIAPRLFCMHGKRNKLTIREIHQFPFDVNRPGFSLVCTHVSSALIVATGKPPATARIDNPDLKSSAKLPLETSPSIDKPRIWTPRLLGKRSLAFDDVIPERRESRPKTSRSPKIEPEPTEKRRSRRRGSGI